MLILTLLFALSARADNLRCSLQPSAVVAAEAPVASRAIAALKRFTAAKFPGASFQADAPSVDATYPGSPVVTYPIRVRTREGRILTVRTEHADADGLRLFANVFDRGLFTACQVVAVSPKYFQLTLDFVDARERVMARTTFGTPQPDGPVHRGPGVCLTQCPPDEITGLPSQCDPSLLCN